MDIFSWIICPFFSSSMKYLFIFLIIFFWFLSLYLCLSLPLSPSLPPFLYWFIGVLIFWILIFYQSYMLQVASPVHGLCFWTKVLNFNIADLIGLFFYGWPFCFLFIKSFSYWDQNNIIQYILLKVVKFLLSLQLFNTLETDICIC